MLQQQNLAILTGVNVLRWGLKRLVTQAGELDLSFVGCLYLSSPSKVNFPDILMKENALAVKSLINP